MEYLLIQIQLIKIVLFADLFSLSNITQRQIMFVYRMCVCINMYIYIQYYHSSLSVIIGPGYYLFLLAKNLPNALRQLVHIIINLFVCRLSDALPACCLVTLFVRLSAVMIIIIQHYFVLLCHCMMIPEEIFRG